MSKFEIKNFHRFDDGSANFNLTTTAGMYYDCKLVAYQGGHFLASAQSRGFDKSDGSGKGYVKAFGALQGTKAADFFNEVAVEAARLLRRQNEPSSPNQRGQEPFEPSDSIPF